MAIPSAPTLTSIVTEGLKKAGYKSPSSALITRASDEWMEEIKGDIWTREKRLKSLHINSVLILTAGQNRYTNPTDYASDMSLTVLYGDTTGTAQAGTVSTITIASTDTASDYKGREILITANTGKGSISQCITYNSTTKVATMAPNFNTAPDSTSEYMWIDKATELTEIEPWKFKKIETPSTLNRPREFYPFGDSDFGEFILYPTPDKVYGVRSRYYANLLRLDLAGTRITTLYRRWRSLLVKGIQAKALEDIQDSDAENQTKIYFVMLEAMIREERTESTLSNMQAMVSDYT